MTTSTMTTALPVGERYQDWGKDNPIPELDEMLAKLNEGRNPDMAPSLKWIEERGHVYRKARKLLGVKGAIARNGSTDIWPATINALTLYRQDFRGYTVTSPAGVKL